ncbi:hypothetical protein ACFWIB_15125 [Streptomyces sp. NPDC127051]|uniref:hypothetical protein n=1 Tax=Streptomyces sp. NPDC127051 TaxID=3347119 RepID=UPI003652BE9D
MTAWQNDEYGTLIAHLRDLRRRGSIPARRRDVTLGCAACRGIRRTILVNGERQVVYSEPCLACRGGGATEKAHTSA